MNFWSVRKCEKILYKHKSLFIKQLEILSHFALGAFGLSHLKTRFHGEYFTYM